MYATDCLPISEPVRTTAPTLSQEPITVNEAKAQLGLLGSNAHDDTLAALISAAREQVERDAGIACYTGAFTYKMTEWPDGDFFTIPLRPITSITSITYVDANGDTQTWASSNYALKTGAVKQFVHLTHSATFPVVRGDYHGITVTFAAGYATVAAIPPAVKRAVVLKLRELWLLQMEDSSEAGRQVAGYDRVLPMRSTYP